jgi:hypothetical protein
MKWVALQLLRLYPKAWRERYGTEFEALLQDARLRPADLVDILKEVFQMRLRDVGVFALLSGIGLASGLSFAAAIPDVWVARSTVTLDGKDGAIYNAVSKALSRRTLLEIIERNNLYAVERKNQSIESVVEQMQRSIIVGTSEAGTIPLEYRYRDKQLGSQAMHEIVQIPDPDRSPRIVYIQDEKPWLRTAMPFVGLGFGVLCWILFRKKRSAI